MPQKHDVAWDWVAGVGYKKGALVRAAAGNACGIVPDTSSIAKPQQHGALRGDGEAEGLLRWQLGVFAWQQVQLESHLFGIVNYQHCKTRINPGSQCSAQQRTRTRVLGCDSVRRRDVAFLCAVS